MDLKEYPKITVIMRGYTYDQAMLIIKILSNFDHKVGVEVTTNNPDYLKIIKNGNEQFGDKVFIGVGTVLNIKQAQEAIDAGAKFMLGPQSFSNDIFELAHNRGVITVPAAMTPTEMYDLFQRGADIVKIFPAITVGPSFFKQIQGPFGTRKLMAVGGVALNNAQDFIDNGAGYLGIGSSFFKKEDLANLDENSLSKSVQEFIAKTQF